MKKDAKEITIENTIGPNEDVIKITYRRGITAGDILVDLDMANEFLLANAEGELSLGDVVPPSAELMFIPSSIAGATSVRNIRNPQRLNLVRNIAQIFYSKTQNNHFNIKESFTRFSEFITSKGVGTLDSKFFDNLITERLNEKELANKLVDLMLKIQNLDYSKLKDFKGLSDPYVLNEIKQESLEICAEFMKKEIFSDYTSKLFDTFYQKAFLESKKLTIFKNSEGINLGFDILWCIENFYGDSDFYGTPKVINELINHDSLRSSSDRMGLINQLTKTIWKKSYRQLLVDSCRIKQRTDAQYIQELRNSGANFNEEDIIWITKNKDGEIIWLELGSHNYQNPDQGFGIEHIVQKHLTKSQYIKWGFKNHIELTEFILETIKNNDKNPKFKEDKLRGGGEILYRVIDKKANAQIIGIVINRDGSIVTAIPYRYNRAIKRYNSKEYYNYYI